ncbi:RanBP1 domain [Parelaphostrongylus tenuis]|uniref:RanBP1 domain n=1 Tax=Parelaphostrongylus tenuis TaxID=148309 RepID=A0AAD5MS55_PARTN|nr:RanBP1 domain [Parelaphostrongylus tenuis]
METNLQEEAVSTRENSQPFYQSIVEKLHRYEECLLNNRAVTLVERRRQTRCSPSGNQRLPPKPINFGIKVNPVLDSVQHHLHMFSWRKKSLGDVLGRMAEEKRLRQEREEKGRQSFIFGSKISDRVVKDSSAASENGSHKSDESGEASRPRTAEELFKTAAQQDKQREHFDFLSEGKEETPEKRKEHERPSTSIITVTTGEENDVSIFQTACKLHSFDTEKKTWVERGLANIKINRQDENGEVHHRIVARTTGNHRVVINSKVHADMLFERVDPKRLKISATTPDSNTMQIFLVTIGFSKTAINIDEFCSTLERILNMERAKGSVNRKRKADEDSSSFFENTQEELQR